MPILPLIFLELFFSLVIISSGSSFHDLKQAIHKVLPPVFAQDAGSSSDTSTDNTSPTPDSSALPTDTSQPTVLTPTEAQSSNSITPTDSIQPTDSSTPGPTDQLQPTTPDENSPTPTGSSTGTDNTSESPTVSVEPSIIPDQSQDQPVVMDENQKQAQAASDVVVTSQDVISGPLEHIDSGVEQMSTMQDQKLEQAKTPDQKATLSVDFAKQSIKELEQSLKNDDLATTTFVAQRISSQIDMATSNAQSSKSTTALQNLSAFCNQANLLLRTEQLAVPDEAAQDFEIAQGKCLNVAR